jgi:hypothetical protein
MQGAGSFQRLSYHERTYQAVNTRVDDGLPRQKMPGSKGTGRHPSAKCNAKSHECSAGPSWGFIVYAHDALHLGSVLSVRISPGRSRHQGLSVVWRP